MWILKKWYSFWTVYGQYRPSTPGPTKCPCGIRCHGGDGQSATNTAGFRDVACAWTNTGPGIQHWSTFFQRRSCDKQFGLNDINPSDYFRASCELWSSLPNVEIQKNHVFPKRFESNIIIGILPAEKLWKDEHSKVLDCESREDSNSSKCRCSWSTPQHPLKIFAKCHVSPWNGSNLSLLPPSKWRFRMGSPNLNTWWSLESWEWAAFNPNLPGCWGLLCVTHGHWESYQAWSYPNRVGRSHTSLWKPRGN